MSEKRYLARYITPAGLDNMLMESDGEYLTTLSFEQETGGIRGELIISSDALEVFQKTAAWLDHYFQKEPLPPFPDLKPDRSTPFRSLISELMIKIPYGESITYGELAEQAANILGKEKMSAQAVGQAVGHNPICILIPCHRVIGAGGTLTGYGGGLENKRWLLHHEGILFKDTEKEA